MTKIKDSEIESMFVKEEYPESVKHMVSNSVMPPDNDPFSASEKQLLDTCANTTKLNAENMMKAIDELKKQNGTVGKE